MLRCVRGTSLATPLEPLVRIDYGLRPQAGIHAMTQPAQRFPAPALDTLPDDIRTRLLAQLLRALPVNVEDYIMAPV